MIAAALFGIADRLLIRGPEHVVDPDRVFRVYVTAQPPGMRQFTSSGAGHVTYDLVRRAKTAEAAAIYTVAMEEEDLSLVPYAVLYRFFFIALIDVAKLFASAEEFLNVRMTWGKLERAGRI